MHIAMILEIVMNSKFIQTFIQDVAVKSRQYLCHMQNDFIFIIKKSFCLYFQGNAISKLFFDLLAFSQHLEEYSVFNKCLLNVS